MNDTITRVKCGNCHQYHRSAAEVKACYFPPTPVAPPSGAVAQSSPEVTYVTVQGQRYVTNGCTQPQIDYIINHLDGDPMKAIKYTKKGASNYIDQLKREKRERERAQSPQAGMYDAPNRRATKIPLNMLHAVPDGYYATQQDSTRPLTFFRISRPKSGKYKGALKIQTQHGPDYKMALEVWGDDRVYWHNIAVEDDLLLVVVDPNGAGTTYANEKKRCRKCNTELTDERSRWFGIGPDCEKMWPHVIDIVTDTRGPYKPGWEK